MSDVFRNVWSFVTSDRGLAIFAIVVGVGGILRAEWLFEKLYKREKHIREALLREANTVLLSYASFSRALQGLDLDPAEMRKDGAFAALTSYHFQQLLHGSTFTPQQLAELRQLTREQIEKQAVVFAEQFIAAGIGNSRTVWNSIQT